MPNLYKLLNVRKNASKTAIQKAFRKLAKKTHTDTSGRFDESRAEFERIHQGYIVLMDDERRAKYDATGEVDSNRVDNVLSEIMGILSPLLATVVTQIASQGADPRCEDLVGHMHIAITNKKAEFSKQQTGLDRGRDALKTIIGRFSVDDGENFMEQVVQAHLRQIEVQQTAIQGELAKMDRALAFLKKFKFRYDAKTFGFGATATTGATVTMFRIG